MAKTFTEMPNLTELCEIVIYWLVRLDTFHVLGHKKKKAKWEKKQNKTNPPPQKKHPHLEAEGLAVVWMVSLLQFF